MNLDKRIWYGISVVENLNEKIRIYIITCLFNKCTHMCKSMHENSTTQS